MMIKKILLLSFSIAISLCIGISSSQLCAISISDISSDQDIPNNTVVKTDQEFDLAMEHAFTNLQSNISLNVKSTNFADYSYYLDKCVGLDSYTLKCISRGSKITLEIELCYRQCFKLTQSLKNKIAYSRLNADDIKLLNTAKRIVSQITNEQMSDYEKELAIHDYIVNNTSYDYERFKSNTLPDVSYTAAGVLLNKTAVCQGYSETFMLLLNIAGIDCKLITGKANGIDHSWNAVKLDNEWYMVDSTYDDPITFTNGKRTEVLNYDYFNITSEQIAYDHTWNKDDHPHALGTKYNYFVYNNLLANNYSEFKKIIISQLKAGKTNLSCYVKNYRPKEYSLSFLFEYASSIQYTLPPDNRSEGTITITLT